MTSATLENDIQNAAYDLLKIARDLCWNRISDNCKFILSEIKDSTQNFSEQRRLTQTENDRKTPLTPGEIIPHLRNIYDGLHDINLVIYKSTKPLTVIDIRYYPKSSIHESVREQLMKYPPMLHCKVAQPPWLLSKNEKFDINWEHKPILISWKMFWYRIK